MYDGLPRPFGRLTRLTRRLLDPDRTVERSLRQAAQGIPASLLEPQWIPAAPAETGVSEIAAFGANPGRLRMLVQNPPRPARRGAPLLLLLHGCGQDPVRFAAASGFAALAARLEAPLVLPDQLADNNHHRCFNWFLAGDTRRGSGEVESLREMIAEALRRYRSDPRQVFVAGLSAGGALAAAALAAYPELFAGGAVVAGLPVGAATDAGSAFVQMSHPSRQPRAAWVARVPQPQRAAWPRLSVWHGEADMVVDPGNGDALVAQWTGLLGLPEPPDGETRPAPHLRRRVWGHAVEHWSVAGLGHGFPVGGPGTSADPYVLPAGIAATQAIARFWGLEPA
jgi:poly(hydroxyalkanoate) depolymerase family esterase